MKLDYSGVLLDFPSVLRWCFLVTRVTSHSGQSTGWRGYYSYDDTSLWSV